MCILQKKIDEWLMSTQKKCSKMQIKTTMKHCYKPTRMTKTKQVLIIKDEKQLEFSYTAVSGVKWHNHFGKAWQFHIKLNIQYHF